MEKFTIEEIRNYLKVQDSLGDIFYNLSEENIRKANPVQEIEVTPEDDEVAQPTQEDDDDLRVFIRYIPPINIEDDEKEIILGDGLVWEEIDDSNIVLDLIHQLTDVEPYYFNKSFSITESRFNLDGERYRIISNDVRGSQIMEKLTDTKNCRHNNLDDIFCLDCDDKIV